MPLQIMLPSNICVMGMEKPMDACEVISKLIVRLQNIDVRKRRVVEFD